MRLFDVSDLRTAPLATTTDGSGHFTLPVATLSGLLPAGFERIGEAPAGVPFREPRQPARIGGFRVDQAGKPPCSSGLEANRTGDQEDRRNDSTQRQPGLIQIIQAGLATPCQRLSPSCRRKSAKVKKSSKPAWLSRPKSPRTTLPLASRKCLLIPMPLASSPAMPGLTFLIPGGTPPDSLSHRKRNYVRTKDIGFLAASFDMKSRF